MARILETLPDARIRACSFANGSARKTWVNAHLPRTGKTWEAPDGSPGRIIYIASDQTSPQLESIQPEDRKRLIIVVPDGMPKETQRVDPATGEQITVLDMNWRVEAQRLAQRDWKKEYPDAVAVVWDTKSETVRKILLQAAKRAEFSEKGASQVNPVQPGTEDGVATPQPGDFGMAQMNAVGLADHLIERNPELHVFCIYHECVATPKREKGQDDVLFGPAVTGTQGPRLIPQKFGVVLWLSVEQKPPNQGDTRVALISQRDRICGLKAPVGKGVIPETVWLENDVEQARDFWNRVERVKTGDVDAFKDTSFKIAK